MQVQSQEDADACFAQLVEHCMRMRKCPREEAERMERQNLGYYAGYHGPVIRARVERLFDCEHPFAGKLERDGPAPPEALLKAGMAIAHGRSVSYARGLVILAQYEARKRHGGNLPDM